MVSNTATAVAILPPALWLQLKASAEINLEMCLICIDQRKENYGGTSLTWWCVPQKCGRFEAQTKTGAAL